MGEGREKKSSCAWAFKKCVHILCFNDLFCGLDGSSFVPFENAIFFCLTSQFLLTIHTCSILFTKIVAVSTVIYFLLCFFLKKNRNIILFIRLEVDQLFMIAMPSPFAANNHKSCQLSVCVRIYVYVFEK